MTAAHKGRCQCGDVVFTVDVEPDMTTNCHCRMCQKASGAAYITWAEFRTATVRWSGVSPTWYASSAEAERGFCPTCGTPVAFRYNQGRDIDLPCVLFDDPEVFPPQDEIWTDSRRSWVAEDPHLRQHAQDRDQEDD